VPDVCRRAGQRARASSRLYGCANPKAGAVASLYTICDDPRLNHRLEVTGGVNAEVCAAELKRFFEALRARGEK
jgi:tRNA(adenine34) deaminase